MSEKKYNSRTKQPLLAAIKSLFFTIHHSSKKACRWLLPAKISYHVLKLLKESLLSVLNINLNLFLICFRNRNGFYFFHFKATNVIVCEITEIKLREKLTNYSPGGTDGGYQLPESGPPR